MHTEGKDISESSLGKGVCRAHGNRIIAMSDKMTTKKSEKAGKKKKKKKKKKKTTKKQTNKKNMKSLQ